MQEKTEETRGTYRTNIRLPRHPTGPCVEEMEVFRTVACGKVTEALTTPQRVLGLQRQILDLQPPGGQFLPAHSASATQRGSTSGATLLVQRYLFRHSGC